MLARPLQHQRDHAGDHGARSESDVVRGLRAGGGRGAGNLAEVSRENIVALCDVNTRNLDAAAAKHLEECLSLRWRLHKPAAQGTLAASLAAAAGEARCAGRAIVVARCKAQLLGQHPGVLKDIPPVIQNIHSHTQPCCRRRAATG